MRVEMLWERDDPTVALEARFGFAGPAAVAEWLARVLDEHWGVTVQSCERIVLSGQNALAWVRTVRGAMLLKWSIASDRWARLASAASVTAWLGEQGLPVSAPVPARDGRVQVEADGVAAALQQRIDGVPLDVGDPHLVEAAGATLGRLHTALARYPGAERLPGVPSAASSLRDQVTGWLDGAAAHLPTDLHDLLRATLVTAGPEPSAVQLVHGDYRGANVLCGADGVRAVIDLEDIRHNRPIVEVARSAVLLGTHFHDWGPVSVEVHQRFLVGYEQSHPLTPSERAWWSTLVRWCTLAMVPVGDDPTGWAASARTLAQEPPAIR